jgi:UDP-glucose 4-epimerase
MKNIRSNGRVGWVSSHISEELIYRDHRVTMLGDLSGGFVDRVIDEVEFIQGSINDIDLVNLLFYDKRFDYVFQLAAYTAEGLCRFGLRFNYKSNLIGSVKIINAAINVVVKCLVFTSSIAVFRQPEAADDRRNSNAPSRPVLYYQACSRAGAVCL